MTKWTIEFTQDVYWHPYPGFEHITEEGGLIYGGTWNTEIQRILQLVADQRPDLKFRARADHGMIKVLDAKRTVTDAPREYIVQIYDGGWWIDADFGQWKFTTEAQALEAIRQRMEMDDQAGHGEYEYRVMHEPSGQVVINKPNKEEPAMQYENRKPLHVLRTKLIAAIKKQIEAERKAHVERYAKTEKTFRDQVGLLVAMVARDPGKVTDLILSNPGWLADRIYNLDEAEKLDEHNMRAVPEFKPDEAATKLVRVLEAATDKEIEVTPSDDFYAYL